MYEYENLIVFVDSRGGCAACSLVWVYSREEAGKCVRLFPVPISLSCSAESFVPEDSLAVVEGLACSGRNLVVYDLK